MGICSDQSTTYLKRLGYNVVRHPQAGIEPLQLIGQQDGTTFYLGGIDLLIARGPGALPKIQRVDAADINGQNSSKLDISVGASVLGSVISAMGGDLGVNTTYTNARTVEFHFTGVVKDRVAPLDVGNYLRDGQVDGGNKVLAEYVLGNGRLYVIVEAIKTTTLSVKYETSANVSAKVDVPKIQGLVGGKVGVSTSGSSEGQVTFSGKTELTFGFRCFEIGVESGELRVVASQPGLIPLAASSASAEAALAADSVVLTQPTRGLLDVVDRRQG